MSYFRSLRDAQFGAEILITPQRQLKTTDTVRLVGATFTGSTVDANFWATTVANSGTVTQANGEMRLRTNTTANGSGIVNSVRVARYVSTGPLFFRGIFRCPDTGTTNNRRRWGAFDANNGAFFELNGTTLSVVTRLGGVDTAVPSSSWINSFTLNTNYNAYEIYWTTTRAYFYINNTLVYTASGTTTPVFGEYSQRARAECTNLSNAVSDVSLYTTSMAISRLGPALTRPTYYNNANANETRVLKYGPGTLHKVVINDPSSSGTVNIYDNTAGSGTKIATIDTAAIASAESIIYELDFYTGLTYVTTGGPGDVTFIYE